MRDIDTVFGRPDIGVALRQTQSLHTHLDVPRDQRVLLRLTRLQTPGFFCAGLAAVLLSGRAGAADITEAQALAGAYCAAAIVFDEVAAEALMTPALQSAIAAARAVSLAHATAHPDHRPTQGDGLALTAYLYAAQNCTPGAVREDGTLVESAPAIDPSAVRLDRIEMERDAAGDQMISDVLFAPDYMRRLSGWLAEAVATP